MIKIQFFSTQLWLYFMEWQNTRKIDSKLSISRFSIFFGNSEYDRAMRCSCACVVSRICKRKSAFEMFQVNYIKAYKWNFGHTHQISCSVHTEPDFQWPVISCNGNKHAFPLSLFQKFNIYFSTCERKLFWKIESHFTYSIKRCAKEANEAPDMTNKRETFFYVYVCVCMYQKYIWFFCVFFRFQSKISSPYATYVVWFMV